ncbi:hypothetical protein ASPNIDRAFT_35835 [Aspergillus niger ATCC 1015]|uniref:Uncharacterized protein n=1 Tax=Aspergillus niger (strain ATCC 1015 / CBS 113.46 / FGSC A1144 / LSHB Ac4 / NCTC 3858a / NRRL 328 / USDA 3528.7) TaxID=380704 RepID=G3XTB7_ASPNA|nr:hypothetical protein ASPNIDRAFT_35835 [Aspergillus niger ATCC 1015]
MTIRDHKNPPTFLLSIKLLGSTGHIPVGCAVPRSHYGETSKKSPLRAILVDRSQYPGMLSHDQWVDSVASVVHTFRGSDGPRYSRSGGYIKRWGVDSKWEVPIGWKYTTRIQSPRETSDPGTSSLVATTATASQSHQPHHSITSSYAMHPSAAGVAVQ